MSKRLAPAIDVSVGKWFHPIYGVRLQYAGLKAKGATYGVTPYAVEGALPGQYNYQEFNILNGHVDFLFNLSNTLGGYNPMRRIDLIPFIGVGVARSFMSGEAIHKMDVNAGLIGKININNKWDFNAEVRSFYANKDLDGEHDTYIMEGMGSLTFGFTYRFGKKNEFKRVSSYTSVVREQYTGRIAALEDQIEKEKDANRSLMEELNTAIQRAQAMAQRAPSGEETSGDMSGRLVTVDQLLKKLSGDRLLSVFFKIGESSLTDEANVSLAQVAEILRKTRVKVTITGYADLGTGSRRRNDQLARWRSEAVFKALTNTWHVDPGQLQIRLIDIQNQPYHKGILNRVVLIEFE